MISFSVEAEKQYFVTTIGSILRVFYLILFIIVNIVFVVGGVGLGFFCLVFLFCTILFYQTRKRQKNINRIYEMNTVNFPNISEQIFTKTPVVMLQLNAIPCTLSNHFTIGCEIWINPKIVHDVNGSVRWFVFQKKKIIQYLKYSSSFDIFHLAAVKDTHREKAPSSETLALTKSTHMDIWVVGATNQLIIRGS